MLTRSLKMMFWVMYDHLGKLIVVNFLCVMVLGVPAALAYIAVVSGDPVLMVMVGVPIAWLMCAMILPVLSAGLAHMVKELIETRDGSIGAFFRGMRRWGIRAAGLGVLYTAVFAGLVVNVWFYAARIGAMMPLAGYLLSGLALWCAVFTMFSAMLAIPALVQKGQGIWATVKLSVLLVLDNPLICVGLALWSALLAVTALIPVVLFFVSLAPQVVLVSCAYEMMSRKYAAVRTEGGVDEKRRSAAEVFGDAEDDYLNRGWQDLIFPWKG